MCKVNWGECRPCRAENRAKATPRDMRLSLKIFKGNSRGISFSLYTTRAYHILPNLYTSLPSTCWSRLRVVQGLSR